MIYLHYIVKLSIYRYKYLASLQSSSDNRPKQTNINDAVDGTRTVSIQKHNRTDLDETLPETLVIEVLSIVYYSYPLNYNGNLLSRGERCLYASWKQGNGYLASSI